MSNLQITLALGTKTGSATRKLILFKLADQANDDGECWPSMKTICEHCEISKNTAIANIRKLQDLGVLESEKTRDPRGRQSSNKYTLKLQSAKTAPCQNQSSVDDLPEFSSRQNQSSAAGGVITLNPQLEPSIEPLLKTKAKSTDPRIQEILDYLNVRAGKRFKNPGDISARLKEGYELQDFLAVIDKKVFKWGNDPKMKEYLRPATLFCKKNFDGYVNEDDPLNPTKPKFDPNETIIL